MFRKLNMLIIHCLEIVCVSLPKISWQISLWLWKSISCIVFMCILCALQPTRVEWQWCYLCWRWSGFWALARTKTSPGTARRAASSWGHIAQPPGFLDYSILLSCPVCFLYLQVTWPWGCLMNLTSSLLNGVEWMWPSEKWQAICGALDSENPLPFIMTIQSI